MTSAQAREEFFREHPELCQKPIVLQISDEAVRAAREDTSRAERLAEAAAWLAEKLNDDPGRARSARAAGHVLVLRAKYEAALETYQEAQLLFRDLGDEIELGITLSSSLQPLIYLGRYEEAFARAEQASQIFQRHGDRLRLARLESNVANILHRQDRFTEALSHYQRAQQILEEFGQHRDVAIVLTNAAVCWISLYDFPSALSAYEKAREYCERHHMPLLIAQADYNIAYLYYLRGEYARAIELYRSTREQCERVGDAYHRALCDLDQSELYLDLNLAEESAQLAQEAFSRFEALSMGYEAAKALVFLGVAAHQERKPFRALELFTKSQERFAQEKNWVWHAMLDLYKGMILYHEGRDNEARRSCEAALHFFSGTPLESRTALAEILQAALRLEEGSVADARAACDQAIRRVNRIGTPGLLFLSSMLLGRIQEAQRDLEGALASYRRALAALEGVASQRLPEEAKIPFLRNKLSVYEALVAVGPAAASAQEQPRMQEEIFRIIEKAKSRQLADLIAFRAHALPAPAGTRSGLVEQVKGLREELNWYYRQIDLEELKQDRFSGEHVGALRKRTREREASLLKTLGELQATDEEFLSLQNAATISLETIRSVLPADGVVLSYYQVREMIFGCVLDRHRVQVIPLTPAARIRTTLRLLQGQFAKYRLGADYIQTFGASIQGAVLQHLHDLYSELIQPIRDRLTGEQLIVVPHGFLHYLPFQAFYDGGRFLVQDFAISYCASASLYYLCATKQQAVEERSLVLGPSHPQAPNSALETEIAGKELPNARVLVGAEACEAALRLHAPGCRYVHWSTQGSFRQDNPLYSSLRLGETQLSLFDLYHLRLPVELMVLSGCGPGLEAAGEGSEVIGLARGLFYAGVRAVLVNQWNVAGPTCPLILQAFYRRLQTTPNKAVALQQAMLEVMESHASPYYWAPFVLQGAA